MEVPRSGWEHSPASVWVLVLLPISEQQDNLCVVFNSQFCDNLTGLFRVRAWALELPQARTVYLSVPACQPMIGQKQQWKAEKVYSKWSQWEK